jgi:rubrerythrin
VVDMENKNLESILDRAICNEDAAYSFYMDLANRVEDAEARDTLAFLAKEEEKHKAYLTDYRNGLLKENTLGLDNPINDAIAEHLDKPDLKKDMTSKDIYLVAANRELNSYHFYLSLAEIHPSGEARDLLHRMAQEELKHKEKMEYLYANTAFPQTAGG